MAELKDIATGDVITEIVATCESRQQTKKIITNSLSGLTYIQAIGKPIVTYSVICYVTDEGRRKLLTADSDVHLIKVTMRHGVYTGYISELQIGSRLPDDYFGAQMSLVSEDV